MLIWREIMWFLKYVLLLFVFLGFIEMIYLDLGRVTRLQRMGRGV